MEPTNNLPMFQRKKGPKHPGLHISLRSWLSETLLCRTGFIVFILPLKNAHMQKPSPSLRCFIIWNLLSGIEISLEKIQSWSSIVLLVLSRKSKRWISKVR